MKNIIENIDNIDEIIFKNQRWLELMYGYCLKMSENVDEIENLLPLIEIIMKENIILRDNFDEISNEYYKKYFCLTMNNE